MKKVIYSILVAGIALVSASCQKTDEQFINQAPVSGKSLTVTGSIAGFDGTKVNYDFTTNDDPKSGIKASWAEDDIIFGFDNKNGTFEFTVSKVENGKAIFSGDYIPGEGVEKLYAVYYPGVHSFPEGELEVDLSSQNGTLGSATPAIMCATGTIENGCVHFEFANQTAIVGIYKMKIFDGGTPVGENVEISSVTLNNVNTTGTIKLDGENFGLVPDIDVVGNITAVFNEGEQLTTVGEGIIEVTSTTLKPYFAVIPSDNVNFTVTASDGTKEYSTTGLITGKLPAGKYTYVGKKIGVPVASIGDVKYLTISDAFKAANDGKTIKLEQDCEFDNEVTLSDKSGNITLNLNGYTLTNNEDNRINLNNKDVTLTIEGGKSSGAEKDGKITTNNINAAVIKVTAGHLIVNSGEILVNDSDETTASGKSAIWVQNTAANPPAASVTINGGKITGSSNAPKDYRCYALYVENTNASVSITSGEFSSQSNNLRIIKASSVNITGGTFNSPTSSGEYTIRLAGDYTCNIGSNSGSEEIVVSGISNPVYIYSGTINLNVYSGRYSTSSGTASLISKASGNSSPINVYGGLFQKEVNEAYLAPGYDCVENEDATTKVTYPHIVKRTATGHILVNGESKDTWNNAVTAVNESTTDVTIILLDDIEISGDPATIQNASKKTTTLDLNGCKITRIGEQTRTIYSKTDFVVNDSKGEGAIEAYGSAVHVDGAKLTVNGGNFSGNGYGTAGGTAVVMAINSGSQLTINGGTITCTNSSNAGRAINTNATKVDINGGTIICNDSDGFAVRAYGSANIAIDGDACIYSTSSVAPINGNESTAKIYFRNGYVYSSGSAAILNNSSRVIVTGGYFNKTFTAASGYECVGCSVTGPDGRTYTQKVQSSNPVAKVTIGSSTTDYYSFEEALEAAKQAGSNATIKLQSNVELFKSTDFTNAKDKKIILDLNNNTLESDKVRNMITTTGELDITDNSTGKGGMIKGTVNRIIYLTTKGTVSVSDIVIETAATNRFTTIDTSAIVVHGTSSTANKAKFSATNTTIRATASTSLLAVYYGTMTLDNCIITESSSGDGYYPLKTTSGAKVTISNTSVYTPAYCNIYCMGSTGSAEINVSGSWFYTASSTASNFAASGTNSYDNIITASNCYFNKDIVANPGNWNTGIGQEKKSISPSEIHIHPGVGELEYGYAVLP